MLENHNKPSLLFNQKIFRALFFIYLGLILLADILGFFNMQGGSNFERGVSIYSPQNHRTYGRTMIVSGSGYAKGGVESLELIMRRNGGEQAIPLERQQVKHDGKVLLQLSTFQQIVDIPSSGDYEVFVRLRTGNGELLDGQVRNVSSVPGRAAGSFQAFSPGHYIPLALLAALGLAVILLARAVNTDTARQAGRVFIAIAIAGCEVVIMYYLVLQQNWRASYDLPFHMCTIAELLVPVMLLSQNKKVREFLYQLFFLWGLGGAVMALITPDVSKFPFPGLYFIMFFTTHALIIISVLYMTYIDGYRPSWRAFPKVMGVSVAAGVLGYGICHLVSLLPPYEVGGYFNVAFPPITAGDNLIMTLQDVFGPAPRYMAGLLLLLPVFQFILTLPIKLADRITSAARQGTTARGDI